MMNCYILWHEDEKIEVQVIYSARRSMGLQVRGDGTVYARIPKGVPDRMVEQFIQNHENWIAVKRQQWKEPVNQNVILLPPVMTTEGKKKIRELVFARTEYYANIMGVSYGRISMRNQRTRWGSCSSSGNLNFNNRLLYVAPELVDYVVVHELCHLRHMDHSPAFWKEVGKYLPEYRRWREKLKHYRLE